jgi:amino acid adenylation domain-containing protein
MEISASYHQERLWFIDTFEAGNIYEHNPVYHNIPLIMEIRGEVDKEKLEKSILEVIKRHEVLRTTIITKDNRPVQEIKGKTDVGFKLEECDIPGNAGDGANGSVVTLAVDYAQQPFRLNGESLIRGKLVHVSERLHILVIGIHHIILDRYSSGIISREILSIYSACLKGNLPGLPDPAAHYGDFSQWQHGFSDDTLEPLLFYWKRKLKGKLQPLGIPTDRPRAPIHIYRSGWYSFSFPGTLNSKIRDFTNRQGIDYFTLLLAAFKTLLYRYCSQEEIVVGSAVNNRNQPGTEAIVGPLANLLVLRSFLGERMTFHRLLSQLRQTVKEAYQYRLMPFDKLVLELKPDVDMSRTALFDVLFQYEDNPFHLPRVEGLEIKIMETNLGRGKYDLDLLIKRDGERFSGVLVYNREYHCDSTISRLIGHYMVLLAGVSDQPHGELSRFDLLTEGERRQLLLEWNRPDIDYPLDKTIHRLFEEQAAGTPGHTALVSEAQLQITYRELDEKSGRLAHMLRQRGVQPDSIVGIMMERSIEMIIAILGILKAGGAYLPIDMDYPEERKQYMLADSSARILLTNLSEGHHFHHSSNQFSTHHSGNLAYIIYTSGTTGQPKGCMISHKNVISLLKNKIQPFDFNEGDVWTMFHRYNFDFSVWEMYGALLYGGKLIVIPKEVTRDPGCYLEVLGRGGVSVLNQTPSAFYQLSDVEVRRVARRLHLRWIIFGGEALKPARLKQWKEKYPDTRFMNMFGITETTIHVTYKEIGEREMDLNTGNIGGPLSTLSVYVIDRNLSLVPVGVPGELVVAGEGLARGYLNRPELTNEKFLRGSRGQFLQKEPPGRRRQKIYRSGDLGRWLPDGDIEYLGRIDHQVKIRGFRIELGEIESKLSEHKDVKEAVVILKRDKNGEPYLCAYVVGAGEGVCREYLSGKLPDYMIPSFFVQLDRIPMTGNGKIDRKVLPEPGEYRPDLQQTYVEPETQLEIKIAGMWKEVLQVGKVGSCDNFFELGGNSLKAVQLRGKLEESLEREIPVVVLFEHVTIRSFTGYLQESATEKSGMGSDRRIDRSEVLERARQSRSKHRSKRKI